MRNFYRVAKRILQTRQDILAGTFASQRHYGLLPEVASGAAARALQITTLQLPVFSVSLRQSHSADVQKKLHRLIIFGHAPLPMRNGRVMILWNIIICLFSPTEWIGDRIY